jgi:CubicO group peptidase (beta-lactamase class C family)
VPGVAVAVVAAGEVVHLKGYGVRVAGQPEAVDADTVFQLASVSKPLSSTVVAALVGDGVVSWDDRVVDHLAGFALSDPWVSSQVTLRDLFSHRSGLPDHAGDLLEDVGLDRAAVLQRLRYAPPEYLFRAGYAYTNFGLTAAGEAAARAASATWEDVAATWLFRPLGMTSASYRHADYVAAPNRARLHVRVGEAWVARYDRNADPQAPAGGASASARDLVPWLRLQLGAGTVDGRQVVAGAPLAETHRPTSVIDYEAATGQTGFYGLGWNVSFDGGGRLRLSHSGAFAMGAATAVFVLPAVGLAVAVLTNAAPVGAAEAIGVSLADLALTGRLDVDYLTRYAPAIAALGAPPYGTAVDYSAPPPPGGPPLALGAYTGTYRNDYVGDVTVATGGDGLTMRLGLVPDFPLRHWQRDVFLFQPVGENAYGESAVSFAVGPDGRAAGVVLENFEARGAGGGAGLGTLSRVASPA